MRRLRPLRWILILRVCGYGDSGCKKRLIGALLDRSTGCCGRMCSPTSSVNARPLMTRISVQKQLVVQFKALYSRSYEYKILTPAGCRPTLFGISRFVSSLWRPGCNVGSITQQSSSPCLHSMVHVRISVVHLLFNGTL